MRHFRPLHRPWWAALALLALGCEQDNDAAEAEPNADMRVVDAAPPSADAAPPSADAAPTDATIVPIDAAVLPDQGESPCDTACARYADCSIELCEGFEPDAYPDLLNGCAATCGANPAFATVINGAATCETIVDFGRDQGDPVYAEACRPGQEPLVPDGSECAWPCQGDEICNQGQCVRPDGTCQTEYHCRLGQECQEDTCRTGQFAECRAELDCTGAEQVCLSFSQNPLDPGNCYIACEEDTDCPTNETCNAEAGNICYYEFCGGGTPNGRIFGECRVGPWSGTCYPLAEGQASPQGTTGLCLESDGEVLPGGPCDSQAEGRTPEDRALQCAPGGLCFGDPDDPREPGAALDGQGECTSLCDPRDPQCVEGTACIDFSTPDDPATPDFDDTTYIGACLLSDCDILAAENSCGEGRACRPYAVTATAGYCTEVGMAQRAEACVDSEDCAGVAICGNNGQLENACLPLCDPSAEVSCLEGEACYSQPGWAVGFCVPAGG